MTIAEVFKAGERLRAILDWHLAMPLIDHDGGDEDDKIVEERRFMRALIQPHANVHIFGRKMYVVRGPYPLPPLIPTFSPQDPGDEHR